MDPNLMRLLQGARGGGGFGQRQMPQGETIIADK
jgi:hypothetical protein